MRWSARMHGLALVAMVLGVGVGCASPGTAPPTASEQGYDGPPIRLEPTGDEHIIILTAPTAGWSFSLDEIRDRLHGKDVFVTVRRPNPAYLHAQVEVEQNLGTQIPMSVPVDVYARILDHDNNGKRLVYYLATQSK